MTRFRLFLSLAAAVLVPCALAQSKPQAQPQPVPMPPPIAAPVDKPYVGPITLSVDLSNHVDRVEHVHEEVPVEPRAKELVLLYPEWIPGDHAPSGPLEALGGMVTMVDGQRVQWMRDRVNVYAFHVPLPEGAKMVSVDFDYLSPVKGSAGRVEVSNVMADLEWNEVLMYPAGFYSRDIPVDATFKLPEGWKYATALETSSNNNGTVKFERTMLNTLVDSPL